MGMYAERGGGSRRILPASNRHPEEFLVKARTQLLSHTSYMPNCLGLSFRFSGSVLAGL